ncbi:MAG TPA: nucleoside triphosphate pyrophosphohydrolase [Gammaproteobacteria bacterium]|nr:nucleoside triphosphate pyrophosphohydrolase [Gammaproteobacteria bacterium]
MKEMYKLLQIMADLRNPDGGCPWDVQQDFKSIAAYTVEEAYEVADAIEREDMPDLKNELGDLMFQVVFHAQMAKEQGLFDFVDVLNEINHKLISRHPHVFAGEKAGSDEELNNAWEAKKKQERLDKSGGKDETGRLEGVTSGLPALRWSEKLQKRAARHGFDWPDIAPVFDKLHEEVDELKAEIGRPDNQQRIEEELGDILFAGVSLARHLDVNPEQALRNANRRFIERFALVEKLLAEDGLEMESCEVAVLEDYWQKAKRILSADERK